MDVVVVGAPQEWARVKDRRLLRYEICGSRRPEVQFHFTSERYRGRYERGSWHRYERSVRTLRTEHFGHRY